MAEGLTGARYHALTNHQYGPPWLKPEYSKVITEAKAAIDRARRQTGSC